jgi:hypothetical protein
MDLILKCRYEFSVIKINIIELNCDEIEIEFLTHVWFEDFPSVSRGFQ